MKKYTYSTHLDIHWLMQEYRDFLLAISMEWKTAYIKPAKRAAHIMMETFIQGILGSNLSVYFAEDIIDVLDNENKTDDMVISMAIQLIKEALEYEKGDLK